MKVLWPMLGVLLSTQALAATPVVETESAQLEVGGYVSATNGVQHRSFDIPTLPRTSGVSAGLFRVEWRGFLGDSITIDVHNRFFSRVTSSSAADTAVGLGSTIAPERTLDLRSELVTESGLLVEHDLDRASASVNTAMGDLTLGRQAVTWGVSLLFPVADFWTQFSPFELDTSQKRGVDAARLLTYPGDRVEVDAIVVDRGAGDTLSGGVRLGWSTDAADYHLMLTRNYDTLWYAMGVAADLDWSRVYGEVAAPLVESSWQLELPRATLGLNVLRTKYTVTTEYHFNGFGSDDVIGSLTSSRVVRGEQYLAGQHYVGIAGSYAPREFITFSLLVMASLEQASALLSPAVDYEIAVDVHARLLAYAGLGDRPNFDGIPRVPTEFGAYGESYLLELSAYF